MNSNLPVEKYLHPSLLYCRDLLRLEKIGPSPTYMESFVDSSEEQTMTAQLVLHQICDYDISPKINKFRYWQSPTDYNFSRSFFVILLDFHCSHAVLGRGRGEGGYRRAREGTKAIGGEVSETTKDLCDVIELMDNLCWFSKKVDMNEVPITSKFETKMENLQAQFIITKPDQIRKFLLRNDYLLEILNEAPIFIRKIFGHVPIYLEIDRDPEEGWEEMFITIRSSWPAQKAMELEGHLRNQWFLSRKEATRGKLNIIEKPL